MSNTTIAIAGMIIFAAPVLAAATTYTVEPDQSQLVVRLHKAGLASGMAHNHVVEATRYDGTITWDPQTPSAAEVRLSADARSLVIDEKALREAYGLDKPMPDDKRQKVQSTMESEEQLGVQQHPRLSFRSTAVEAVGDGSIRVSGELSLHGVTRRVSFTTTPTLEGGTIRADAELDLLQSDFGIDPYSAFLGMVKNKDEFTLIVHLVAVAEESSGTAEGEMPPQ